MSLIMFILSIFLFLDKKSFQPKPQNVSSLVIPGFNEVIIATLLIHIDTVSADVTFFENSFMFPINHPSSSDVISLPLLYPVPNTSFVPPATPPRPLRVYTRRPRTDIRSSTTLVLLSPVDLPIAIWKGTCSSRNPHSIYNFLTYRHVSSSYSTFVSTLSSVYGPQIVHEALSHPDWNRATVEEMAALHSSGTWNVVALPVGKTLVGCC